MHAVWRSRCALVRGFSYHNEADFIQHVRTLIEDPWLNGSPICKSKAERRQERLAIPDPLPGWGVYQSDGASRKQPDGSFLASCGCVIHVNMRVLGSYAEYLGDESNNVAEYYGVLRALQHAASNQQTLLCFRVDSMLVAKQLQGQWACRSPDLVPLYEQCLVLLQGLRSSAHVSQVQVEHIYREFNAYADSLANAALDNMGHTTRAASVIIREGW